MQKHLSNVIVAGLFLLLAGCQTNTSSGFLRSYPLSPIPSFSSSSMGLAQAVQDALRSNEDPVIARVHVETNQNMVILSGYVKKIRQSDVAEQIARRVSGGQNIQNNIIVRQ